jgi:TetR/AcrR family transcriptional regulator, transcriptional repressor for nem operon
MYVVSEAIESSRRQTRRPVYYYIVTSAKSRAHERLLDAASALMHARGYEATGVAELCAAAGAPKGSFYYWWPSKQALALAMLDRQWELAQEHVLRPAFAAGVPIAEQFARYAQLLTAVLRDELEQTGSVNGCPFGNLVVELATRDEIVRRRAEEILAAIRSVFATAITAAQEAGEVAADLDADDRAEALLVHLEGLFVIAKARNDPGMFERLPRDAVRLLAAPA